MKYAFLLLLFSSSILKGQELQALTDLPLGLSEVSGLTMIGNKVLAHNDSGNEPLLYSYDLDTEQWSTISLGPLPWIDPEDMCRGDNDSTFYLADIGNNLGTRTSLTVYEFVFGADSVYLVDSLSYIYKDQESFSPNANTRYDCEAIIHYDMRLQVFTKNRQPPHTSYRYQMMGVFEQDYTDSILVNYPITGAAILNSYYLVLLSDKQLYIYKDWFFQGIREENKVTYDIPIPGQWEAITFKDQNTLLLAPENENLDIEPKLYQLDISKLVNSAPYTTKVLGLNASYQEGQWMIYSEQYPVSFVGAFDILGRAVQVEITSVGNRLFLSAPDPLLIVQVQYNRSIYSLKLSAPVAGY